VINRQLIYNYPEQLFTEAGIVSIEHADFEGVERLALVLGAEIASTFDAPDKLKLGYADLIEEVVIGEDRVLKFTGCAKGEACTVVLRGSSHQVLDEAERSLHDALCVLVQTVKNTRIVYGGGCSEMLMAKAADQLAVRIPGKESLAIEAFARALRQIPVILSDNAGYDSQELVAQLRAAHYGDVHKEWIYKTEAAAEVEADNRTDYTWFSTAGLDMDKGTIGDMSALKVTEALKSKMQVLISAHEAAEMILRVDDIIRNAPRQRAPDHRH
jgi:T-complex protein 1 subunit beta